MTEPIAPRMGNEPGRWYSRFLEYLRQPPEKRSLLASYKAETGRNGSTSAGSSWNNAFRKWKWLERARIFDDVQAQKCMEQFAETLELEKRARLELLIRSRKRLNAVLKTLSSPRNKGRWSPSDLWHGIKVVGSEMRAELEPAKGTVGSGSENTESLSPAEFGQKVREWFGEITEQIGTGDAQGNPLPERNDEDKLPPI